MSTSGYVIPLDPASMANRFAEVDRNIQALEEGLLGLEDGDVDDDVGCKTLEQLLREGNYDSLLTPLLDRIPSREADLIKLYFIDKKRQADIALIFDVTQAAVSYRLGRGLKRIKFLLSIPHLEEEEMREELPGVFKDSIDVDILVGMWHTTCQSEVAKILNLTQGRVRHRFFSAITTLEVAAAKDPRYEKYYRVFKTISNKNFNLLREVVLPQWQSRGQDKCQ
ncbi:MAG: sigma factor-like helix-turn-helix DNA-binding protein [Parcubacteria group bacterium]